MKSYNVTVSAMRHRTLRFCASFFYLGRKILYRMHAQKGISIYKAHTVDVLYPKVVKEDLV